VACGLAHGCAHRHPPAAVAARVALGGTVAGLLYTLVIADNVNPMLAALALAGASLLCAAWVALAAHPRAGMAAMLLVGVASGGFCALLTLPATQSICRNWPGRVWEGAGSGRQASPATTWYTRHRLCWRDLLRTELYSQVSGMAVSEALRPAPRNVLIIGERAYDEGRLLRAADRDRSVQHLDFAADDLQAEDTMRALFRPEAPPDPRVRLLRTPVREFLRTADGSYDLIAIIRAGLPLDADVNRYYTCEFLVAVRRALAPGGVVYLDLPGATEGSGPASGGILQALQGVFPETPVLALGASGIVAATSSLPATAEARSLAAILWQGGVHPLPPIPGAVANTDLRPGVYADSVWRWWRVSHPSGAPGAFPVADGAPAAALLLFMLIPALLLAYQWRRSPRVAFTGWAMFCVGFITISVLLTAFLAAQSQTGEIAYLSGALLAALMAGTGLGAAWGARAHSEAQALVDLRRAQLSLLLLCLIAPLAVTAIPTLPAVMLPLLVLLLVGTGFLTGAVYPLAAMIYGDPVCGAASLHALGLLGGAGAGALLCIVVIPAAGIPAAAMAAAAVAAFGLFGAPIVRALLR
jgi:hypothetical protein